MTGLFLALLTILFFPGVILRVKNTASGRKGAGFFQPWRNIFLLLKKGSIFSRTTSYIFQIAPLIYFSTILCAILLLPFAGMPSFFGFDGDFVLFAYLLALGKFFFIIGAIDTGSSFEGMGANREALYSMLLEPALFILFGTLALLTGHTSMQEIFVHFQWNDPYSFIIGFITVYLLIQIAMIENSRMPVDDPKTHLELTMIHEVMILDNSGFDLALIHIGAYLKFAMYGTLIAECILPAAGSRFIQVSLFFGIQVLFASTIGILESFRARKKLMRNPQFIVTLSSIALIAFFLVLLIKFKLIH